MLATNVKFFRFLKAISVADSRLPHFFWLVFSINFIGGMIEVGLIGSIGLFLANSQSNSVFALISSHFEAASGEYLIVVSGFYLAFKVLSQYLGWRFYEAALRAFSSLTLSSLAPQNVLTRGHERLVDEAMYIDWLIVKLKLLAVKWPSSYLSLAWNLGTSLAVVVALIATVGEFGLLILLGLVAGMFALRIFFPIRNAVLNSFYQWQTNHARAVGLASRMRNAINSAFNHKSMHTLLDESVFSLNRAEAKLFFMVSLPAIVALGVAGMLLGIGTVVFSRGYLMQHLVEIALLLRLVPVAFSAHTFSRGNFSHANLASEFFNFLSVADRAKYDAPVVRNDLLKKLVAQVQAHNTVWIAGPSGIGKSLCLSELAAHYSDNQIDYFFQNQITINDGASLGYLLTWEVERDFYSWEDVARVGEKFQIDKNICFAMADGDVDPLSSASGGELQRLWLVRALLSGKKLLLLDEPLSGVNSDVQQKIWEEFRQCSPGVKIVCISHSDLSSVFESRFTIDREGDVLTGVGERLFC